MSCQPRMPRASLALLLRGIGNEGWRCESVSLARLSLGVWGAVRGTITAGLTTCSAIVVEDNHDR